MTVHLLKLCVGTDSIAELEAWHGERRARAERLGEAFVLRHVTRSRPRRADEVLDGGSLYWIIKGLIQVRQPITDLVDVTRDDGTPACAIILAPDLVPVHPRAHRAFQGWRYLEAADAPRDLESGAAVPSELPAHLAAELRDLGLL